jgi:hypothetical protein
MQNHQMLSPLFAVAMWASFGGLGLHSLWSLTTSDMVTLGYSDDWDAAYCAWDGIT